MATVYVGRLRGAKGFWRLVAIKRAHAHLVGDEVFRKALIAEARLASHIHHPNVVSVVDVEEPSEELLLIMDYVEGASLSQLITAASKQSKHLPPEVVVRIVLDAAAGLHAAHELVDEHGAPLEIVHRDVSPQNVLVGVDGSSRIADFGIAKCADSGQATQTGLKGKVGYMAPEYIAKRQIDRRVDVFALGVVAWEALTGERLFKSGDELGAITAVLECAPRKVTDVAPWVPAELEGCITKALKKSPDDRYADVITFARDLEAAAKSAGLDPSPVAVTSAVGDFFGKVLDERRETLRGLLSKNGPTSIAPPPPSGAPTGEVTRTKTVDVRASISDVRTAPFVRLKEEPPVASSAEHTQDLTALADAAEAPASSSSPRRRWGAIAFAAAACLAIAGFVELRASGPKGASSATFDVEAASSAPPAAPLATTAPAAAPPAAPATTEAAPDASASAEAASASASADPATPRAASSARPADKAPTKRPPTPLPTYKTGLGKRPDRPGLGY